MGDFIFMTWQEFEQQFSIQLNEQQKSAVQSKHASRPNQTDICISDMPRAFC